MVHSSGEGVEARRTTTRDDWQRVKAIASAALEVAEQSCLAYIGIGMRCRRDVFIVAGMSLHATVARRRLAEVRKTDASAIADADAWMMHQGIRRPERMARFFAPGFSTPLTSSSATG